MENQVSLLDLAATVVSRSAGTRVECAVTLGRHKRPGTIGGSTDKAMVLERIEQTLGEGPCIDALVNGRPVLLDDAHASPQWHDYCGALSAACMRSTLGVPMVLEDDGVAVLVFFAPAPRQLHPAGRRGGADLFRAGGQSTPRGAPDNESE